MKKHLAPALLLALVSVPLAWLLARPAPAPLPELYPMPAFALTSEQGAPFGNDRLAGKVSVANFVFTRCPTVCPTLGAKMAKLQARFRDEPRVKLLSFSVDPRHDTPEVLRAYAAKLGADPSRWTFLTGELHAVEEAVERGFKIHMGGAADPDADAFDIVHGEHFVLVDGDGVIRGYYRPDDEDQERLADDVVRLLEGSP